MSVLDDSLLPGSRVLRQLLLANPAHGSCRPGLQVQVLYSSAQNTTQTAHVQDGSASCPSAESIMAPAWYLPAYQQHRQWSMHCCVPASSASCALDHGIASAQASVKQYPGHAMQTPFTVVTLCVHPGPPQPSYTTTTQISASACCSRNTSTARPVRCIKAGTPHASPYFAVLLHGAHMRSGTCAAACATNRYHVYLTNSERCNAGL